MKIGLWVFFFFFWFCSYLGYQIIRSRRNFSFDFHSPYCPCFLFSFTILSSDIYREAIVGESYLHQRLITTYRLLQTLELKSSKRMSFFSFAFGVCWSLPVCGLLRLESTALCFLLLHVSFFRRSFLHQCHFLRLLLLLCVV